MKHKSDAATVRQPQQCTSGVTCEAYSTAKVIHSNNSYSIFSNGQRIASFLTQSQAIRFAREVTL